MRNMEILFLVSLFILLKKSSAWKRLLSTVDRICKKKHVSGKKRFLSVIHNERDIITFFPFYLRQLERSDIDTKTCPILDEQFSVQSSQQFP